MWFEIVQHFVFINSLFYSKLLNNKYSSEIQMTLIWSVLCYCMYFPTLIIHCVMWRAISSILQEPICVYFFFFLAMGTSTDAEILCTLCDILCIKYNPKQENMKHVVTATRWTIPQANIDPSRQKAISGNNFAWNPSPNIIASKFDTAWKWIN